MYQILKLREELGLIEIKDLFKIFDATLKPILCYRSNIWGYHFVEQIEKVQITFCKKICLLPNNTCDFLALGECGRLPLCITYIPNCIKYWISIIRMDNTRYPKQYYYMLYQLDESGRNTWASKIKDLLFNYGFGYVWRSHDIRNDK